MKNTRKATSTTIAPMPSTPKDIPDTMHRHTGTPANPFTRMPEPMPRRTAITDPTLSRIPTPSTTTANTHT